MNLQREPMTEGLFAEAEPLVRHSFDRFDPFPDLPLDIDVRGYVAMEAVGALRIYTARENGVLLGYAVFIVAKSLRRKYLVQAQQDMVHAVLERQRQVTPRLLKYAEKALREEGIGLLFHTSPIGSKFGQLLTVFDYPTVAALHAKRL